MHTIGQILNYDSKREFQLRGPEHPCCGFHIMGAYRINENDDSEVTAFIDKQITYSILNENGYPALNKLINKVQQHSPIFTCRKKKGFTCRFNVLWPLSEETLTVCDTDVSEVALKRSK